MQAFTGARHADDSVWTARAARAEALGLRPADPTASDPKAAGELAEEYRLRITEAEEANAKLTDDVRDKMLGTRPPFGELRRPGGPRGEAPQPRVGFG